MQLLEGAQHRNWAQSAAARGGTGCRGTRATASVDVIRRRPRRSSSPARSPARRCRRKRACRGRSKRRPETARSRLRSESLPRRRATPSSRASSRSDRWSNHLLKAVCCGSCRLGLSQVCIITTLHGFLEFAERPGLHPRPFLVDDGAGVADELARERAPARWPGMNCAVSNCWSTVRASASARSATCRSSRRRGRRRTRSAPRSRSRSHRKRRRRDLRPRSSCPAGAPRRTSNIAAIATVVTPAMMSPSPEVHLGVIRTRSAQRVTTGSCLRRRSPLL